MSDKKEAEKENGKEDTKASAGISKKLLFIVVGGMLLLMVVGIGATVFIMRSLQDEVTLEKLVDQKLEVHDDKKESHKEDSSEDKSKEEVDKKEEDEKEGDENAAHKIIYIPIIPEFVVNFHGEDRQHFLQLEMSASTLDAGLDRNMRAHMPLIRNSIVMLLGAQSYESMKTIEGKNALREKALGSVQEILKKETGSKGVEEIYFTEFVMQ